MCTMALGLAMTQFVVGAGSAVMGYEADKSAAAAQNQQYENNRIEANKAATDSYASDQLRMQQEQAAASQDLQNNETQGAQARATAEVAAGEGGVSGLSVDSLVNDYFNQQGQYERTLDNNFEMQSSAIRDNMDGTMHQTAGRINSVQKAQQPSFAGAAVRILGSGVDSYGTYQRYNNAAKTR